MGDSDFKKSTITGLKWNTLNRFFSQLISLIISIILARLLSPQEFGIVGMVIVFTGFGNVLVDFGFASAIIQKKDSDEKHWNSVFWLNVIISFFLAVLVSLIAPLVVKFYNEPALRTVTIAVAWTLFLQSFNMVQSALLKKTLNFKRLMIIGNISQLIGGIVAIYSAYRGFSFWSLILKTYITILITTGLLWVYSSWKPKFMFNKSSIKELLNFTLPLVGTQSLNYWVRNADYLMIGRVLGDVSLGVYSRAYTLMLTPLTNISRVISGVMFPAYSIIQDDKDRIRKIYLKITRSIALITFPAMFGLVVVAKPFVLVLLGDKWIDVYPILQILAPLGAVQSLSTLNGNIFLSQGETKLQLKIGSILQLFMIISMVIGLYLGGLKGIALAYLLSSTTSSLIQYYYIGKLINSSIAEILNNLKGILIAAMLMTFLLFFMDQFYFYHISDVWRLLINISLGVLFYFILLVIFKIDDWKNISELVRGKK